MSKIIRITPLTQDQQTRFNELEIAEQEALDKYTKARDARMNYAQSFINPEEENKPFLVHLKGNYAVVIDELSYEG